MVHQVWGELPTVDLIKWENVKRTNGLTHVSRNYLGDQRRGRDHEKRGVLTTLISRLQYEDTVSFYYKTKVRMAKIKHFVWKVPCPSLLFPIRIIVKIRWINSR